MSAEAYIKRHEGKSRKKDPIYLDNDGVMKPKSEFKPDPTPLEIAKMIRDNNYGCHKIVLCEKCPIEKIPCGNSTTTKENFNTRKKVIDSYISSHEPAGNTDKLVEPDNSVLEKIKKWYEEKKADFEESVQAGVLTDTIRIEYQTLRSIVKMIDHIVDTNKKVEPVIEPIKFDDPVPEYVYKVGESIIRIKIDVACREKTKKGEVLDYFVDDNGHSIDMNNCYKTLDEAVIVAKSKWSIK